FFFSSRRRHTRSKRDWSSDVCSSDLDSCTWHLCVLRKGARCNYPGSMADHDRVQSVDRAIRILEMLAREGEKTVGEVAGQLQVHSSTASRLIDTLAARELLERNTARGSIRLAAGLLRLAGATASQLDLSSEAQPVCDALAGEVGETTNVAILSGDVAINVCQAQGTSTVTMHNWVGQRTVLHATSSGKVLLAYLDSHQRARLLRPPLQRFTEATRCSAQELRSDLGAVRKNGWARAIEEYEDGLNAVAAPLRGHDGKVVAALSAAGPAYRLSLERLPDVAARVMTAADEVSARMGYRHRASA